VITLTILTESAVITFYPVQINEFLY